MTPDRKHTFCIYDGPTPEAVRRAATRNKLPISQITEVCVLDPYFYKSTVICQPAKRTCIREEPSTSTGSES